MAERIWAALTPERVQLDPGGPPATVVIGVQNLAAEVDHLSIEVEGLDPTWHSGSGAILQLFPNERGQAQLILKVPSRSDVRSGTYPFTVKVRSRVVPSELATASGVLEVKPQHSYRFDVTPKRSLGRHGRFRATIKNSGTADVELQLQGKDPEALCRSRFRSEHLTVIPGAEVNVLFKVKPRRSGLVGDPKTFNLTITAASDGGAEAKSVTAQFVHQPRFRSWGPLVKLVLV
ncbi:MAG: hypothetical protein Q7O66_01860, partial [Dehalococcoidia bacterium]|nr:hypothetical protein [Dehalococcoidia bacterium]